MSEQPNGLDDIERAIAAELRKYPPSETQYATAMVETDAPALTPSGHTPLPPDIGLVPNQSTATIAQEYEMVAQEIEATGTELVERARQCAVMVQEAIALRDELRDGASRLRREAALITRQMEYCFRMTSDAHKAWGELKTRLDSTSRIDTLAE